MEKNADPSSAKKSGNSDPAKTGFEMLGAVLKRRSTEKATPGGPDGPGDEACSAKLETVVEEGVVKKIIVRCTCGEVIEIDCDYGG